MLVAGDTLGHEGGASPMGLALLGKGLGALASPLLLDAMNKRNLIADPECHQHSLLLCFCVVGV